MNTNMNNIDVRPVKLPIKFAFRASPAKPAIVDAPVQPGSPSGSSSSDSSSSDDESDGIESPPAIVVPEFKEPECFQNLTDAELKKEARDAMVKYKDIRLCLKKRKAARDLNASMKKIQKMEKASMERDAKAAKAAAKEHARKVKAEEIERKKAEKALHKAEKARQKA